MGAERTIRTVRTILTRKLYHEDSRNWPAHLQNVLKIINSRVHSSIGMAPDQVSPENASKVFARLYPTIVKDQNPTHAVKPKFSIGQPVRCLVADASKFEKGDASKVSANVYIIAKILYHPLFIRYKVKDKTTQQLTLGTYNESELVPVSLPQNG